MHKKIMFYFLLTLLFLPPISVYAGRGCCSHHGGVSYCGSNGYYICNDNSQSPSCLCNSSSNYIKKGNTSNAKSCDYSSYETKIKELQEENNILNTSLEEKNEELNQKDSSIDNYRFGFFIVLVALFVYAFKYYQKPKN